MTHRIPKRYTILISCTGKQPIVLSFHPMAVLLTLGLGVCLPIVVAVAMLCSYADRNSQLAARNSQLTREASSILKRLELLEDKVGALRDQSALPQLDESTESTPSDALSQSYVRSNSTGSQKFERTQLEPPTKTDPEVMLSVARDKIPSLLQLLQTESRPLTEQDLMRDAARPRGVPILGDAKISSPFGLQPSSSQWGYELHQGLDFTAAYGSLVQATAPGVIEEAGWDTRFGNRIVINHGYGYLTLYAHLSKLTVAEGTSVERNQVLGYLGNSGRSSTPHLHYGIYRNGFVVDPQDYLN
ncbi:M23 family metallopeptidase [Phormidium tenue FACHB-886]|nr:M23 family metallopeptidase [Phormidium tenue FACHB-886]